MSLINELNRRNVFRVGAAYLVVAWLLIQIADTVGDMLALPDVVGRTILLLVTIGFPIALLVSWVYEVTPDGIATQEEVDAGAKSTSGKKLNAVIIGGLALVLGFVIMDAYVLNSGLAPDLEEVITSDVPFQGEITATAELEKSIAVLPFANLSSDPEQEYFSDGLSEELLNKLAQVPDLLVAARTSSFYYKGKNEDMRTIGEELGVNYILEGSVRKSNDQLRITAQLIQADNGFHLWSDTYDRQLADIFAIQDEIGTEVTRALSITLAAGEFDDPEGTQNVAAYDAYLQATSEFYKYTPQSILASIELINESLQLDPDCFKCWQVASFSYDQTGLFPQNEHREMLALHENALENMRRILPDAPILMRAEAGAAADRFDWTAAENILLPLLEEPSAESGNIYRQYGSFLLDVGRLQEALVYMQRAARLTPRNSFVSFSLALTYLQLGRIPEALEEIARGKALGDNNSTLYVIEWFSLLTDGNLQGLADSVDEYYVNLGPDESPMIAEDIARRSVELMLSGDRETAIEETVSVLNNTDSTVNRVFQHWVLDYFEASDERTFQQIPDFTRYVWSDLYRNFRQEPEFRNILEDRNLVNYWRASGNWPDKCRPLAGSDDFECF